MLSPTLFPYAPANVCRLWRDLLAIEPAFWTRIIIVLDSPSTTPDLVRSYFERTRDEPIHVWITRADNKSATPSDPGENDRIKTVMRCLRPHLARCVSLSFNLLYRSSAVIAGDRLRGYVPRLRILALNSRVTDSTAPIAHLLLDAPELHMLELDAHSFAHFAARKLAMVWLHRPRASSAQLQLRLTRYQPAATSSLQMSDVVRALEHMPDIELLSIRDVAFASPADVDFVDREIHTLHLEELRGSAASMFFRCLASHASRTTVVRCDLDGEWDSAPVEGRWLRLVGLADAAGLARAMRGWSGSRLHADECPGFTDAVVSAMAEHPAGEVEWVSIDNTNSASPPLSFDVLKSAVNAWTASLLPHGYLTLYVQQPGNLPDAALCRWFDDRVGDFSWKNDGVTFDSVVPDVPHPVDYYGCAHLGRNVSPHMY
ncbi:hypothetical protein CONPUDRAFT_165320 [Coniophora puteana RWD-64-598 SS2]|uniref:F-box domain-containing protein n=1 Tax=Coniophora puteana (strain RWD-64-598) TaxID=741705 RepID=A0A5M3MPI7_CONPW|nr:uncharacterized protein CONPUDRAFT_165320 [Coniophora puteana RWD-64-598 SS2]EIW81099.1 hypothetical protein CONPUDRAFT_165320 [Coniophora puteana RWD-64-598 SS2]